MYAIRSLIIGFVMLLSTFLTSTQELPRCGERQFLIPLPLADPRIWCIERPLKLEAGEWAVTSMAVTLDGTLYGLRPFSGELYILRDTDGDALPDTPELAADGMNLPAGMVADGNVLYILGNGLLYRFESGSLTTLVDDLPSGRGFMASGIAVHSGIVYLGIPMPCDFCEGDHPFHGTVLSFDTSTSELAIVARGLRYPAALAWHNDQLWVSDTARDGLYQEEGNLDEINVFDPRRDIVPHFGFPYCIGIDNRQDLESDFICQDATPPFIVAATQSMPFALIPYSGESFPHLVGDLLIVQAGSSNRSQLRGYQVVAVDLPRNDEPIEVEILFPTAPVFVIASTISRYDEVLGIPNTHTSLVNNSGMGVFPHRILGLAISQEGWIYISVGGGSIYVLRPGDIDPCTTIRECNG